jgi:hypothetical protein
MLAAALRWSLLGEAGPDTKFEWTGLQGILSITDPPHDETTIVEWNKVVTGAAPA